MAQAGDVGWLFGLLTNTSRKFKRFLVKALYGKKKEAENGIPLEERSLRWWLCPQPDLI